MKVQGASFKEKVLNIVHAIPRGSVLTYKEVAEKAGNSQASRVVGNLMASNDDKNIPCHRVIKSDGTLGGYNGLKGEKDINIKKRGLQSLVFNVLGTHIWRFS